MNKISNDELNCLIYMQPIYPQPTRYEMIRYSTWRIYLFQELESIPSERLTQFKKTNNPWVDKFPKLVSAKEDLQYYMDFFNEVKNQQGHTYREDVISHFICRMLYCHDNANHSKFIQMEKLFLSIRLNRRLNDKKRLMEVLKRLLAYFMNKNVLEFNLDVQDWNKNANKITVFKQYNSINDYALVPIQFGEAGMRRRSSFIRKGNVYMNIESTIQLTLNLYASFLQGKLQKMRGPVLDMINNDVENQMSAFLRKTLQTLNSTNFDEVTINNDFKLTIKNVETLWKRFFPPCMLNLNQKLKQYNHLKHDGRRQLWLFLKGCGMDCTDNQQFFRKHFMSKVSNSQFKSHMYNIQHAYGLVGKKQAERPKNCRSIITSTAPKKDEHHGCPFAHWRKEDLREYLRKNYNVSEANLDQIMKEKDQNHFQVACGRLFEGTFKSQGHSTIPAQITSHLGKSPHQYFQAGMEMINTNNKAAAKAEKIQKLGSDKKLDF